MIGKAPCIQSRNNSESEKEEFVGGDRGLLGVNTGAGGAVGAEITEEIFPIADANNIK